MGEKSRVSPCPCRRRPRTFEGTQGGTRPYVAPACGARGRRQSVSRSLGTLFHHLQIGFLHHRTGLDLIEVEFEFFDIALLSLDMRFEHGA